MEMMGPLFGFFFGLVGLVLSIILIVAQLRLFSIDRNVKAILDELRKQGSAPGSPATMDEQARAAERARIAQVQENWPGYSK